MMKALIGESDLQELGNRIIRLVAKTAQKLTAPALGRVAVRRRAEHAHEEFERRDLIRQGEDVGKLTIGVGAQMVR